MENFPSGITDRELIDALFSRLQLVEGRMLTLRDALTAVMGSLSQEQRQNIAALWTMRFSDSMATLNPPAPAQDLHRQATKNRSTGYQTEWELLQRLLGETEH